MKQSDNASDGSKSLELQAKRHIACTSQKDINVDGDKRFLLKFDYQSDNAKKVAYYISFDDKEKTNINEKLKIEDNQWHTLEKQIEVPKSVTKASLRVYSYPESGSKDNEDSENIITRYDNFYLVRLPNIKDKHFYLDEFVSEIQNPTEITTENINRIITAATKIIKNDCKDFVKMC